MHHETESQAKILRVLVADDRADIRHSAALLFKTEGIKCETFSSPSQVLKRLEEHQSFDIALLDLNYQKDATSGREGIDLITDIRSRGHTFPIIVMTAWASIDIAVNAMKEGANDFISKPWKVDRLLNIVKTQVALAQSLKRNARLEGENRVLRDDSQQPFLTQSPALQNISQLFERTAQSDASVLITGENGTGKSHIARLCHELSTRRDKPFISVNMGALAESVFESEIFGHEKGAFTGANSQRIGRFELADTGTLFLDEIANITAKQQAALLQLIENRRFERVGSSKTRNADVRIICATNADLAKAVSDGHFRQDLYFRINAVPVHLPPLRERVDDLQALTESALNRFAKKYDRAGITLSPTASNALTHYQWPGNVRELFHVIERAVLISDSLQISEKHLNLPTPLNRNGHASISSGTNSFTQSIEAYLTGKTLTELEYEVLDMTLTKYMRQPDEAAKALGISRSAFYRKLAKHGFDMS